MFAGADPRQPCSHRGVGPSGQYRLAFTKYGLCPRYRGQCTPSTPARGPVSTQRVVKKSLSDHRATMFDRKGVTGAELLQCFERLGEEIRSANGEHELREFKVGEAVDLLKFTLGVER